ncbi:serum response factor-binding protein 1-like isoform X2 [Stegodyphus dumicola]|uniref:serum response factor-binding protein 1-like isoform X2 n=1 Tax=Stegodyphus dumicola TaxID=202533 RepID=UPI0015AACF9B|nr:serum response factor-binding protein 1-like isoform X2 [Stegodyphus dumicola]
MALAKKKDWHGILKQKTACLNDRCFALLASYNPVQREVKNFHEHHSDLIPKLSDLLQEWKEKRKRLKESRKAPDVHNRKNEKGKKVKFNSHDKSLLQINKKSEDGQSSACKPMEIRSGVLSVQTYSLSVKQDCNFNKKDKEEVSDNSGDSNEEEISTSETRTTALNTASKLESKISCYTDSENDFSHSEMVDSYIKSEKTVKKTNAEKYDSEKETESHLHKRKILHQKFKIKEPIQKNVSADSEREGSDQEECNDENHPSDLESEASFQEECNDENPSSDSGGKAHDHVECNNEISKIKSSKVSKKANERNTAVNKNSMKAEDSEHVFKKSENIKSSLALLSPELNEENTKSTNAFKTITVLNLDELHGLDEIPIISTCAVEENVVENKHRNDPFFLGGSEMLSEKNDIDSSIKEMKYKDFNKQESKHKFSGKKNFSDSFSHSVRKGKDEKTFHSFERKKDFKNKNYDFQMKRDYKRHKNNSFQSYQEKSLNHSGAAKFKNQKKDLTAEKNRPGVPTAGVYKSVSTMQKKLHALANNVTEKEKPLHPSWEAKRKLKEVAASNIKGKRMVFD